MKRERKNVFIILIICLFSLSFFSYNDNLSEKKIEKYTFYDGNTTSINKSGEGFIYVSDVPYVASMSSTSYSTITMDKIASGGAISLKVDGDTVTFTKGIFAHATSTLVYDLSNYQDYDYFTAYVGVNATADNGNGVKFYIYTSQDGKTWDLKTEKNPKVIKGTDDATFVKIDIHNVKYLKLYAYDNVGNSNDYSVYADAKFVTQEYLDNMNSFVKPVAEYDQELKKKYTNQSQLTKDYELLLLQRTFVSNVGYNVLQYFMSLDDENAETIKWLMTDYQALREYVTGGNPVGSYYNSLKVLNQLYHTYKDDLSDLSVSSLGIKRRDLYLNMMLSLSLTHSTNISLWVGGATGTLDGPNDSDPVTRYDIYKDLYLDGLLNNTIFENLSVEEMRWVMNNSIDDEEIKWLNYYSSAKKDGSINPYSYITYKFGYNYWQEQYYDLNQYDIWNSEYGLSKYNVTYKKGYPKLWIVFEQGAVCDGLSKTGSNLNGVYGIPSAVIEQPNHTAYLAYAKNSEGKGMWVLENSISGWDKSQKSERMLNGWGSSNWDSYYQVSYILLAQAALNDLENYKKAEEFNYLAQVYSDDLEKSESLYRQALKIQPINMDAWYNLIQVYIASDKSELEFYELAQELMDNLAYYPLPMHDLLNLIKGRISSPLYSVNLTLLEKNVLQRASESTSKDTLQPDDAKTMADYLLANNDFSVANFSFNGENAGIIVLSEKCANSSIQWEYSLDGGRTWKQARDYKQQLTQDELNSITSENDIKVHIVGFDYSNKNIYTIDIQKSSLPTNLYGNDLENRIIGAVSTMEWRYSNDSNWTSYTNKEPDLTGNKTVVVRMGASGIYLPSDESKVFKFTLDADTDTKKYIPISRLSVASVSSESTIHSGSASMAIDGNLNTRWITDWDGLDTDRYIVIQLDKPVYLSALQYVPIDSTTPKDGMVKDAVVSVSMDGKNWTEVGSASNWSYGASLKTIEWNESVLALYVKFATPVSWSQTGGTSNFTTAAMINLFEDTTKKNVPTASIKYSTTDTTNGVVVATLVNPSTNITIINNDGRDSYTFKENGEFTFRFVDSNGEEGSITAKVTWIDKNAPSASISYDIIKRTNDSVVATITLDKDVEVINNGGKNTYTFKENGEFTFEFMDSIGNKGRATARVDWIDKKAPKATISYDTKKMTNKSVTATIKFDEETIITNNDGKNTYTFDGNGAFEFQFEDDLGNKGSAIAKVDWIDKESPVATISYSTIDPTNKDVEVKLTNISEKVTILNNDGKDTYTFTENGRFTFEFMDRAGNIGKTTAYVDWIDKGLIIAEVTYNITLATNQNVVATMDIEEGTVILNNDGKNTYTFKENGRFIFEFVDRLGNRGKATARVNWIDKESPTAEIVYDIRKDTESSVEAFLTNVSEDIVILNNNGKDTYTFTENGSFTFEFMDEAGNEGKATAKVNWIAEKEIPTDTSDVSTSEEELVDGSIDSSSDDNSTNNNDNSLSNEKELTTNNLNVAARLDNNMKEKTNHFLFIGIIVVVALIIVVYVSGKIVKDKKSIF